MGPNGRGRPLADPGRARRAAALVGLAVAFAIGLRALVPLGASAGPSESPGRAPAEVRDAVTPGRDRLGLQVQPLDSQTVDQTGVLSSQGVLVTVVELGRAAGLAGIRPGDVIRQVNRQTVGSVGDFERAMGAITGGELVRLWIQRGRTSLLVVLEP